MDLPGSLANDVLDEMTLNVAVLDEAGTIVDTNRPWREFGAENDILGDPALIGENYLEACGSVGSDSYASLAADGIGAILSGERDEFHLEYPCHSPDEKRWFRMYASGFEHDGDRYCTVVHQNITDRLVAEIAVRRRNEELESFARVLSHDLRNPIAVARGWADVVSEETESVDVDRIHSALDRMDSIIGDALTLMRTNSLQREREEVSLAAIADEAWEHVDTEEATLRIEESEPIEESESIDGYPGMLLHVFENLFRNAVEHAGETATITVGTTDDGFFVADDGPGIPVEERDQIFELGYTTVDEGTGFGLAIVERFVALHGWEVYVTDGADGGSRFEIRTRPLLPVDGVERANG